MANRQIMLRATVQAVYRALGREAAEPEIEVVNCHHNYVAKENHFGQNVLVTRKGAGSSPAMLVVAEPMVRRLPAGGEWIRTSSTRKR